MLNLQNVTLNGRPVTEYIAQQLREEINTQRKTEVSGWHVGRRASGSRFGNTSGARSGRGRLIYSRNWVANV